MFLVSSFLYRLDHWFSTMNEWFYTRQFLGPFIISLLFDVSQGSLLKTVLWPIMVYFYKLRLEWRVVLFALNCIYKYKHCLEIQSFNLKSSKFWFLNYFNIKTYCSQNNDKIIQINYSCFNLPHQCPQPVTQDLWVTFISFYLIFKGNINVHII